MIYFDDVSRARYKDFHGLFVLYFLRVIELMWNIVTDRFAGTSVTDAIKGKVCARALTGYYLLVWSYTSYTVIYMSK